MSSNTDSYFKINDEGHLVPSPELALKWGLKPGNRVYVDVDGNYLNVHRSANFLSKLYIEPTNQCNLDCRTCMRNVWDEPMGKMSDTVFNRIIEGLRAFSPVPTIFLGGFGEPLFHPGIVDMVGRAKSLGARVELITNGTMLTTDLSAGLIKAGLDMLWVSIDGATPESYADIRLGATLPRVLENIAGFRKAAYNAIEFTGVSLIPFYLAEIGIAFVVMKRNLADLPAIIDIAQNLGASRVSVSNVLPYSREMCDEALFFRSFNKCFSLSLDLPGMDVDDTTKKAISSVMSNCIKINWNGENYRNGNGRCPFIESGAGAISWEGNLSPCLPLLHSHISYNDHLLYDKRFSRRWSVGNVMERSLIELWKSPDHNAFRERVQTFDFSPCTGCSGCDLSENNESDCFGSKFPTCGGCLWSQGVIQCP